MPDNVDSEWWNRFFAGPWLEVQRSAWGAEETLSDAQTIERLLAPAPGAELLDVPCGEGRVALELAARGYRVTGVDLTEAFLDTARAAAARRSLDVRFEQRDMRTLDAHEAFDHAFCWWG